MIISVILFLAGTVCAFALEIKGTAPTTIDGTYDSVIDFAFKSVLGEINKEIKDINIKPEKFIESWGSSQVFASSGAATQRAYGEYKIFCFTLSPITLGLQLPSSPFDFINDIDKLPEKLNQDKDIKLGFNPQLFNARIGINTSKFLLKNLFLGMHFGYMKLDGENFGLEGFSFDTLSIGATANYQFIASKKFANGLLLWRGVNIGTGFIYSGSKLKYSMPLGKYEQSFGVGALTIDPKITLDMKIDTFTIPIEATTAVKFLKFLNIPLGMGMDIGFGTSDMKVGATGDIHISGIPEKTPGNISLTAGGAMPPTAFNLKLMTGVGFNIGPVIIDIPFTYYFLDNGYSVGFTLGAIW